MSVCVARGGFTWAITLGITFTAPASTSFCMSGHKFCMSRHKFCMSGHKFLCLDTTFDTISGTTCHTTFCKKLCFDTTFMVSNTTFYVRTQLFMSGHNFLCPDTTLTQLLTPLWGAISRQKVIPELCPDTTFTRHVRFWYSPKCCPEDVPMHKRHAATLWLT